MNFHSMVSIRNDTPADEYRDSKSMGHNAPTVLNAGRGTPCKIEFIVDRAAEGFLRRLF